MNSSYKRFLHEYIYKYKNLYIKVFLILIIQNLITMYIPLITSKIVDYALPQKNKQLLLNLVILMFIGYILSFLMNIYKDYSLARVAENIIFKLRYDLNKKISRLENSFFTKFTFSDIISKYDKETLAIKQNCAYMLVETIGNIIKLIIALGFMLFINKYITFVFTFILFIYYINSKYWGKRVRLTAEDNMSLNASVVDAITENYNNVYITKIYNAYDYVNKMFVNRYEKFLKNSIKLELQYSENINISSMIIILSLVIFWIIGGFCILNGTMTIGQLLALISYNSMASGPIRFLSQFGNGFQSASVSIERVYSILDYEEENLGELDLNEKVEKISFRNVNFSYNSEEENIIKDANLQIDYGKITALVGLSGSGKSTITNLITGICKPNSGDIFINNKNLNNFNIHSLRNSISLVTQDSLFFRDTILENLSLGCNRSKEEIIALCEELDLYSDISKLPNMLDTVLSTGANDLSGGQKKRLDIVRAILKDSSIIIFDESTANLDLVRRRLFFNLLNKLKKDKIIIFITHNLNELSNVDDILILENGTVNNIHNVYHNSLFLDTVKKEVSHA